MDKLRADCWRAFELYQNYETNLDTREAGDHLKIIAELIKNNRLPEAQKVLEDQSKRIYAYTRNAFERGLQVAFYRLLAEICLANRAAFWLPDVYDKSNLPMKLNEQEIVNALRILEEIRETFDKPRDPTLGPKPGEDYHNIYTKAVRFITLTKVDKGTFIINLKALIEEGNAVSALSLIQKFEVEHISPWNGDLFDLIKNLKECLYHVDIRPNSELKGVSLSC